MALVVALGTRWGRCRGSTPYLSTLGSDHIDLTGYIWCSSAKIGVGKFRLLAFVWGLTGFMFRFLQRPQLVYFL